MTADARVRQGAPRRAGILVYNPLAGSALTAAGLDELLERTRRSGLELAPRPTAGPGSATEIVRRSLGGPLDVVAVAGGDGTVGDAAAALAGTRVPLAILPTGTVNVVAREYGIGTTVAEAERALTSERTRPLALWNVAGRTSLISVGVGFDARVMKNIVPVLKRLFGRVGIGWTATLEWLKYEFPPIEVEAIDAEGRPLQARATFVVAANTRRYGGDAIMTPHADPADDLLDLVLFGSKSRGTLIRWYGRLSKGDASHLALEGCTRVPVRSFTARSLAGYELDVQVDGDAVSTTPVEVTPVRERVDVLVP